MIETLVRFIYNRCDVILVQSRSFIQSVKLHCTRRPRIEYYPNSTESFYRPVMLEENAPEKSLVPEGFIIMFAGNIGVAQDFETILEAADLTKHLPQIKWVIVGDGRQKEWVHSEVTRRKLENTVHLLGRYRAEQMPRFFSLADALLVTLKRDPVFALTIPSKVQSYLACARPIIAALDGEGARIVDESGVGISCPAESPLELADAVMRMYRTSREDRVEMGLKGRDYYEKHFDRDLLVNRLEDIMKDALRENTI
jgi:glycosyltransferase involved in cell wall biosynthesis